MDQNDEGKGSVFGPGLGVGGEREDVRFWVAMILIISISPFPCFSGATKNT